MDDIDRYFSENHPSAVGSMRRDRQPLFDTLVVPEDGVIRNHHLFVNMKQFPDGSPKLHGVHHNFVCEGFLAAPLYFRLNALEVHVEKFACADDVVRVLKNLSLEFVLGQENIIALVTGSTLKPYLSGSKESFQEQLDKFAERGAWLHYRHEMTPRILESTISFRIRVNVEAGELKGPVWMKVMMQDTLVRPA